MNTGRAGLIVRSGSVTTARPRPCRRLAKRGNLEAKIRRLVYAFDEQALAIAAACAAPNTRRAYATAYRAFGGFLRARYGTASRETFTVAAWPR